MGLRTVVDEGIEAAIWAVNWLRSSVASDGDVEAQLDDPAGNENAEAEAAEVWTIAGVQSRPKDGDETTGYAKALRIQLGDTLLVIGTHDPRHVEACEPGEVVVHALGRDGASRALMRLRPDGAVVFEGTELQAMGTNVAAKGAGVEAHLTKVSADLVTIFGVIGGAPTYNFALDKISSPISMTKLKGS